MKRLFTTLFVCLLLGMSATAQELGTLQGYTNAFVRLQTVSAGSGKVTALAPNSTALKTYKETYDFKKVLPVALDMIYFNVYVKPTTDYMFGGWYLDDGDGVFDISKDELMEIDGEATLFLPVSLLKGYDGETTLYETEQAAAAAPAPQEPQALIFALFTNGATAMVDYHQEDCGTVEISKPVNAVGDEITIKAIPAEGYRFEYWKTGYGSQFYQTNRNTSVSEQAEWTFTVKGGEKYYAYFSAIDAPVLQFPEEGGWMALAMDHDWFLHEQANAMIYNLVMGDIITNEASQTYFNLDNQDAQFDVGRRYSDYRRGFGNKATLIWGKGEVHFTHYIPGLAFDRYNNILEWSGPKGITINDKNNVYGYHVYIYRPELNAFVEIGTTDSWEENYTTSVTVPANTCYLCMEGNSLANLNKDEYIPKVIGMTAADYDNAVAGVEEVKADKQQNTATYDLQGRRISDSQLSKGLYIINGKKVIVK